MRWVLLLRAVNLGSTNKLSMNDLKAMLAALGYEGVRTHLQSGNALFDSATRSAATIERDVERALREFGMGPSVRALVRTAAELGEVIANNPFADADPKELHVVFLAKKIAPIDTARFAPNEFAFGDRCVYLRLPNGVQGARLPDWDRVVGVPATMRTWRSVTRLNELANG